MRLTAHFLHGLRQLSTREPHCTPRIPTAAAKVLLPVCRIKRRTRRRPRTSALGDVARGWASERRERAEPGAKIRVSIDTVHPENARGARERNLFTPHGASNDRTIRLNLGRHQKGYFLQWNMQAWDPQLGLSWEFAEPTPPFEVPLKFLQFSSKESLSSSNPRKSR